MARPKQTLREAVREALGGVSRQALDQRVDRLKRSLPMSDDDAVGVIGHQNRVDIARWLEPDELGRVATYVSQLAGSPAVGSPRSSSQPHATSSPAIEIAGYDVGKEVVP